MQPEVVVDCRCVIGENPLWHAKEGVLYWTDIPKGKIHRFDPSENCHEELDPGGIVGGFTIQSDGSLLLFMDRGSVSVWRDGELLDIIAEMPDERGSRFNDVIADPVGRVFCGTMPTGKRPGSLYRLDLDGRIHRLFGGIGCSNGMGFSPDRGKMYHTDSVTREICVFDYDVSSGELRNKTLFLGVAEGEGTPDGMTVDAGGLVWSAIWDGSRLARYTSEGDELMRITFPARKVSSLTFGGPECEDIYVTTAGGEDRAREGRGAGALFRVRAGVRGVPEFLSRVGL